MCWSAGGPGDDGGEIVCLPCLPLQAAVHSFFWLGVELAGALCLAPSFNQWLGGWAAERSRQGSFCGVSVELGVSWLGYQVVVEKGNRKQNRKQKNMLEGNRE